MCFSSSDEQELSSAPIVNKIFSFSLVFYILIFFYVFEYNGPVFRDRSGWLKIRGFISRDGVN